MVEKTNPPQGCLDILAQHLVSMAAFKGGDGQHPAVAVTLYTAVQTVIENPRSGRDIPAVTALREGRLRLLCATSSMELGIDVGEIDQVLQVGCPRTVSGTMQRLGRAGHNPGRTSVMYLFPRTPAERTRGLAGISRLCS